MDRFTFPIIGVHGGGTSLVSSLCISLGVSMGDTFMGPVKGYDTWEDVDFVRINMRAIHLAGGKWSRPPALEKIYELEDNEGLLRDIQALVKSKTQGNWKWGWKDPRNCLTIQLYHAYLTSPHYIFVKRPRAAVVRSMLRRGGREGNAYWEAFYDEQWGRITEFRYRLDAAQLEVQYDNLVNKDTCMDTLVELAHWVRSKRPQQEAERAMRLVKFR